MEVRGKNGKGKHLFDWSPEKNQIEIIIKDMFYQIQFNGNIPGGGYKILKEIPKNQLTAMK